MGAFVDWFTGRQFERQIEEVVVSAKAVGQLEAAQTVRVYACDVNLERTYTGVEVYTILHDISTILSME